jgi:poly(A) polymerase
MARQKDNLPAPPELPSFRVEPSEDERDLRTKSVAERHAQTGLVRHDAFLEESSIDADAAKVVRRLERHGFQAYLVGGCIRDLLLGGRPKDFDIATSARPEDVRALFRNCRVIGRRFRLAHVLFGGGKVIEVATFRKNPQELEEEEADLLIRSDNVFGEAHEDAIRRDFTINALFYDLDRRQVLDWCGGMEDITKRTIRTIGEPSVRFREDPVRILRAIKFAARLDLGIEHNVYDAMISHRDDLARAARPRVFEEVLRLLRHGCAHRAMWITWESGVMAVLMPELAAFLDDEESHPEAVGRFWRQLDALDRTTHARGPIDDVVLMTTLFYEPLQEAMAGSRDRMRAAGDFLVPISERIALPRRIQDGMRRIIALVPRLRAGRTPRAGRNGEIMALASRVLEVVAVPT